MKVKMTRGCFFKRGRFSMKAESDEEEEIVIEFTQKFSSFESNDLYDERVNTFKEEVIALMVGLNIISTPKQIEKTRKKLDHTFKRKTDPEIINGVKVELKKKE